MTETDVWNDLNIKLKKKEQGLGEISACNGLFKQPWPIKQAANCMDAGS